MAEKIRREKDLIQRTVNKYIEATTETYTKYFDGGPSYIVYYQLDSLASTQDTSLENVHSLVGTNTPNKYKKIEDVVIYGVDAMDISQEITGQGLKSLITGEFIMLPDSIKPYPGDFFTFDYDGLRDHLFRIDNVQFDKASPKKFFRVTFALYPDNSEVVLGTLQTDGTYSNISGEYAFNYQDIGGQESAIVSKADSNIINDVKKMYDAYVDKFANLFYHEDMDVFTHRYFDSAEIHVYNTGTVEIAQGQMVYTVNGTNSNLLMVRLIDNPNQTVYGTALENIPVGGTGRIQTAENVSSNLWSPYLQKFLYNNKILSKYKKEILVEFYINDIDQRSNPEIFSDLGYANSIFRKLETQNKNLEFSNSFMSISSYDLKQTRNLPFFHSNENFKTLLVYNNNPGFYMNAFHFLFQNENQSLLSLNDNQKILETPTLLNTVNVPEKSIVYKTDSTKLIPSEVYYKDSDTSIYDVSLSQIISPTYPNEVNPIFNIIKDYLNDSINYSSKDTLYLFDGTRWVIKSYYSSKPAAPKNNDVYFNGTNLVEVFSSNSNTWVTAQILTAKVNPTTNNGQFAFIQKSLSQYLNDLNNTSMLATLENYILMPMLLFVFKSLVKDSGI